MAKEKDYFRLYEPSTTKKRTRRTAPDYTEYNRLREKFLMGEDFKPKEREKFRVEADLIAQSLKKKGSLDSKDFQKWRSLPTNLQKEVKGYRAGMIAKKYGISDLRKFMTATVPSALGLAGTIAGGLAGGIPTGGIGAGPGAAIGGTIGQTGGEIATALANKLFPGGPENPKTAEDRRRLRAEMLLDYYQPQQEPFYYEPKRSPEASAALQYLRSPVRSRYGSEYNYVAPWMQSSVPGLQRAASMPGAQEPGAKQGITGLWNRLFGRRR